MEGTEKGNNKIQSMLEQLRKEGDENNKENNDDEINRQNKQIVKELNLYRNNEEENKCKQNEDKNINEVMIPNTFRTVITEQNQNKKTINNDTPNKKSFKLFHSVFPKTQQNNSNETYILKNKKNKEKTKNIITLDNKK